MQCVMWVGPSGAQQSFKSDHSSIYPYHHHSQPYLTSPSFFLMLSFSSYAHLVSPHSFFLSLFSSLFLLTISALLISNPLSLPFILFVLFGTFSGDDDFWFLGRNQCFIFIDQKWIVGWHLLYIDSIILGVIYIPGFQHAWTFLGQKRNLRNIHFL